MPQMGRSTLPGPVHPVFTRRRSQMPIRRVASKKNVECEAPDRGLQNV